MSDPQRSCLDLIEEQFLALAHRSCPITIDAGSLHPSLPQHRIPLHVLRVIVLNRQATDQVKDAVWSHLARMTRAQPDPWTLATAGMMAPGLKSIAARLRRCFPGDPRDLDSEILEAFLQALACADPNQPGI